MNYHHLQFIANDQLADRLAEADRSRLARSGHTKTPAGPNRQRSRRPGRTSGRLGSLFHRVALL